MKRFLFVGVIFLALSSACSYQAGVSVSPAYDVYSSFDDKIPGNWAVYVNSDEFDSKIIKVRGLTCSAYSYPLDISPSFSPSVVKTIENVFENVELLDQPITASDLRRDGLNGLIIVRAEELDADLNVISGFWENDAEADVELTVSVLAEGEKGRLFGTTVSEDGDFTAELGSFCEGGSDALGKAAENALEKVLERLAERVANSPRLRNLKVMTADSAEN